MGKFIMTAVAALGELEKAARDTLPLAKEQAEADDEADRLIAEAEADRLIDSWSDWRSSDGEPDDGI